MPRPAGRPSERLACVSLAIDAQKARNVLTHCQSTPSPPGSNSCYSSVRLVVHSFLTPSRNKPTPGPNQSLGGVGQERKQCHLIQETKTQPATKLPPSDGTAVRGTTQKVANLFIGRARPQVPTSHPRSPKQPSTQHHGQGKECGRERGIPQGQRHGRFRCIARARQEQVV